MTVESLFNVISSTSAINWTGAVEGCEARANLAGEIISQECNFDVEKIWAVPPHNGGLEVYIDESEDLF